jgi:hypothetical protein
VRRVRREHWSAQILISILLAGPVLAQEATGNEPWCASERDRGSWVDLNYKARDAMAAKLERCHRIDEPNAFGACLAQIGYIRSKPRNVFRK